MAVIYANDYGTIGKILRAANAAGERGEAVGLDTEFYGVDVGKQSCYARATVHLVSMAIQRYPTQLTSKGVAVSDAAVFTNEVLGNLEFVRWLESNYPKAVHNLPVDAHSLKNHGIELGGGVNTLALARWAWPERARGRGFTLDSLGQDFLNAGKMEDFNELFQEEYQETRSTFRKVWVCECGATPCRKRQSSIGHTRIQRTIETVHTSTKLRPVALQSVVPGHVLWDRAVAYSAQDAILALGIYNLARSHMAATVRDVPWLA